jgi:hypothetical protein
MNLKDCQDIQWLAFTKAGCGGEDAGLLRIGITITIHCMSKTCGTKPKTNPKFKTMQTWRIPSHTFTIHKFSCFIVFVMSHHMSSPFDILWEPLISASETSWFHPIELPWVLHCFGSSSVAWQASQFTAMRARFQGMQCIKMYQT